MTLDKSLKASGRLVRSRNVLKRAERIATLELQERWQEEANSPLGLPKVRIQKATLGKKKKKKKEEEEETTEEAEE